MTGLFFKTIILGSSLVVAFSFNTSDAADGDPAMAVPPASGASSALEAASPTTPAASAPKTAASAPKAAASAASAPASAPAAAASAPAPAEEATATAAPAPIEPAALSTREFYGFSFAIRDAQGLMFDSDMNVIIDEKIWPTRNKTKYLDSLISDDENMFFDFGGRKDGGYEVITTNKITKRAIMTVFKDKKPVSQTIVGAHGAYTATESFCEVLKTQTKSKDFEDLKSKAAMCSDFYARSDESKAGMAEHIQTHRANIERMSKSPAKSMVEKDRADFVAAAKDKLTGFASFRGAISSAYGAPSVKPRPILSRATSPDDIRDRNIVGDIAEACGRLWGAKPAAKPAAAAVAPKAAPKKTVK